jgi:iron complex outermembrane receptor protein
MSIRLRNALAIAALLAAVPLPNAFAGQASGSIAGRVVLEDSGAPLHNVSILVVGQKRAVETDENGNFTIESLPPGSYDVLAHMDRFPDVVKRVEVEPGATATLDFELTLEVISEEVTVTATGREVSTFESFQAVSTLDSTELAQKAAPGIGEVLDGEPGVAKRSFGPGSSRPVIRGFDGDRVLVLADGERTGSVSSQSGDHGEPLNVLAFDKVEIVKGPATLLYGSNAIGGVVNAISGHSQVHEHPHEGLRGFANATAGSANALAGGNGGFEYGAGNWLLWGNGGALRTGDYDTPIGVIPHSASRTSDAAGGFGYFGDRAFASFGYERNDARYGVPFASAFEPGGSADDEIRLDMGRNNVRVTTGVSDLQGFVSSLRVTLNYSDYEHREIENGEVGTTFNNKQFVYRAQADQRERGPWKGSFGVWGLHRDYETKGGEALSPPVTQNAFAAFGLQELDYERVKFQFGARLEHNGYAPDGLVDRSFTGFSSAAGVSVGLWENGRFVANVTSSYRAPALEELYNFGPHVGNLTFEIGDATLGRERSNGVDVSLRHETDRFRGELNLYYYAIRDFVYLAPTGEVADGLRVARYAQGDGRYRGLEALAEIDVAPHVTVNLGLDAVNAHLVDGDTPLPRIPPVRARAGLTYAWNGLRITPSATFADAQDDLFPTETRTAGYAVFDLDVSYTLARQHVAHVFSVNAFNLGDRLYRNHLSLIKDLAPEIGRGVRVSYGLRFF